MKPSIQKINYDTDTVIEDNLLKKQRQKKKKMKTVKKKIVEVSPCNRKIIRS